MSDGRSLLVFATALVVGVALPQSLVGQSFPAGAQGTWKVVKKIDTSAGSAACGGGVPTIPKGAKISIGPHALLLEGQGMTDARPTVQTMSPAQFMDQYLGGQQKDLKRLALGNNSLEIITPASESAGSEHAVFDRVIVRDPSSLLFERCGTFFETVHAGGFQAPTMPDR